MFPNISHLLCKWKSHRIQRDEKQYPYDLIQKYCRDEQSVTWDVIGTACIDSSTRGVLPLMLFLMRIHHVLSNPLRNVFYRSMVHFMQFLCLNVDRCHQPLDLNQNGLLSFSSTRVLISHPFCYLILLWRLCVVTHWSAVTDWYLHRYRSPFNKLILSEDTHYIFMFCVLLYSISAASTDSTGFHTFHSCKLYMRPALLIKTCFAPLAGQHVLTWGTELPWWI